MKNYNGSTKLIRKIIKLFNKRIKFKHFSKQQKMNKLFKKIKFSK